jgi:hypothetical protein
MLYLVIEHFRDGNAVPVYQRFRERGRLMPPGLTYVASWVEQSFARCFQIVECDDVVLLNQWMAHWSDLVDFEVVPVMTSAEAAETIAPRL